MQTLSYGLTVLAWLYWRIWYFPFFVLFSIAVDSKSLIYESSCTTGTCSWQEVPERVPFLLLLGLLCLLNFIWFSQLIQKGLREFRR